jgi:hypothetical protein
MLLKRGSENIICRPPEKKEGSEEESCRETMVKAADAVVTQL